MIRVISEFLSSEDSLITRLVCRAFKIVVDEVICYEWNHITILKEVYNITILKSNVRRQFNQLCKYCYDVIGIKSKNRGILCKKTEIMPLLIEKKQIEDESLMKLWNRVRNQLPSSVPLLTSADEIRAWMSNSANAGILSSIETLDLSNSQLQIIPTEIKRFTRLKELYLSRNRIRNIDAIGKLTQLRLLDLSRNRIQKIDAIKKLPLLINLGLSRNQIQEQDIKAIKKQLTQLQEIYYGNGLLYYILRPSNMIRSSRLSACVFIILSLYLAVSFRLLFFTVIPMSHINQ